MAAAAERLPIERRAHPSGDELTGLPDRELFAELVRRAIARNLGSDRFTVVFCLGIDKFRDVNDMLGYASGDRLLCQVAERLRRLRRERADEREREGAASALARLGGDKFLLLFTDLTRSEDVGRAARHAMQAIAESFRVDEHEIFLTASVGISVHPPDADDPRSLIEHAETALFYAKRHGPEGYHFYAQFMNRDSQRRLSLEAELRKAIPRGELTVSYQPWIDSRTAEMVGMEALLRWRHPRLGCVEPAEFIPVAEETGMMPAIGEFALRAACRQTRQWQEEGLAPPPLAVNVSCLQLRRADFVPQVERTLQQTGLEPGRLVLELTERGVMQNDVVTLSNLCRLKDLGVRLAVDDFGTGSSSFGYLKSVPLDVLKLDRSYVAGITEHADDAAIVPALISLAQRLHLTVVAEGVESEAQLRFLRRHDCHVVQGFLFSRPLPAGDFGALLARRGEPRPAACER